MGMVDEKLFFALFVSQQAEGLAHSKGMTYTEGNSPQPVRAGRLPPDVPATREMQGAQEQDVGPARWFAGIGPERSYLLARICNFREERSGQHGYGLYPVGCISRASGRRGYGEIR